MVFWCCKSAKSSKKRGQIWLFGSYIGVNYCKFVPPIVPPIVPPKYFLLKTPGKIGGQNG